VQDERSRSLLSEGAQRDRGAPENGDLRDRLVGVGGCGVPDGVVLVVVVVVVVVLAVVAGISCNAVAFAANETPLCLFQQEAHVYEALLRGVYIIRFRVKSNIMNHVSRPYIMGS